MPPPVHIVTLNWQNWPVTSVLLRALRNLRYEDHRVVVVDNGSTDDSVERLRELFPEVELIEAGRNLGFGGGNNLALRRALDAGAAYAWVLNNDAEPDPDALKELVETAERYPRAGAVGSVIHNAARRDLIDAWGGARIAPWIGYARFARRPGDTVTYITGTSMLLRCEALRETGLFDESLFMYWEDADLCLRLREKGWALAVADRSRVWHTMSTTTGRDPRARAYHIMRSYARFLRKHYPHPAACAFSALLLQTAGKTCRRRWDEVRGLWAGWKDRRPDGCAV